MSDMISEGSHQAVINAHALTEQKDGTEVYTIEFKLNDGSLVLARYKFGTDKATDLAFSQLRALGWKGDDLSSVTLDMTSKFTINVKHDQGSDGKTYVSALVLTGGIARFALPVEKARSFAEKMRDRVRAFDSTGKSEVAGAARTRSTVARPPQQRTTRDAGPPPDDDFGPLDY